MHELPQEVQDKIRPLLPPEAQEQLLLQNSIAKGLGVGGGGMVMSAPRVLAQGTPQGRHRP